MSETVAEIIAEVARALDDKGRCCGRKPIPYKRPTRCFCPRCNRQYGPDGKQQSNWAWAAQFGNAAHFIPTYPAQAYARQQQPARQGSETPSKRPEKQSKP